MASDNLNPIIKLWSELRCSPLRAIHRWQSLRLTWLIMLDTSVFLELAALGFQYIMDLQPCELCVYQRLAVMLLILAPLVMLISPKNIIVRIVGYGTWVWAAFYGLQKALLQTSSYASFDPLHSTSKVQLSSPQMPVGKNTDGNHS